MSVKFSTNAVTTLSASISVGATSFTVASASPFPTLASGDWTYVSLTSEVVKVTAISGTTFTCDATVNAHASGESVELRMTAELLNDFAEDTEALPKAGGTMTGDVSLGDNVKAKFGASDDLEIYHDPTYGHSHITESGTGNLKIQANNIYIKNADDTANYIHAGNGAEVALYHNNALKLATTSTGVDVTGSVTCDGFTSTGIDDNATSTAITIDASENVGIGTTAPSYPLEVQSGGAGTVLRAGTSFLSVDPTGSAAAPSLIFNGDGNTGIYRPASDTLAISTNGSERMRIESDGRIKTTECVYTYSGVQASAAASTNYTLISGVPIGTYLLTVEGTGVYHYGGLFMYRHFDSGDKVITEIGHSDYSTTMTVTNTSTTHNSGNVVVNSNRALTNLTARLTIMGN